MIGNVKSLHCFEITCITPTSCIHSALHVTDKFLFKVIINVDYDQQILPYKNSLFQNTHTHTIVY